MSEKIFQLVPAPVLTRYTDEEMRIRSMGFLNKILKRPDNERPFLLLVAGHPVKDTKVPNIKRKHLKTILTEY